VYRWRVINCYLLDVRRHDHSNRNNIRTEKKKYIEITTATVGRFFFICSNLSFTARRVYNNNNNNINDTPRPSVVSDFYNNNNNSISIILLLLLLPTTVAPLWRLVLRSAGVCTRIYTYISIPTILCALKYCWPTFTSYIKVLKN